MPKFSIDTVGGRIVYDFTGWNIDDKGFVPEPSRDAVNTYLEETQRQFKELNISGESDDALTMNDVAEKLEGVQDDSTLRRLGDIQLEEIAKLCAGSPKRESLEALPYRPFMAFVGYLIGELTSPEALKPDTMPMRRLKSV